MKTSLGREYNFNFSQNNKNPNNFFQNIEQFKSSNNLSNPTMYQNIFKQNMSKGNSNNIAINSNKNKMVIEKNKGNTIPINKIINFPKPDTYILNKAYFNPQKNMNPSHMQFNNGVKKVYNKNSSESQDKAYNNLKKSVELQKNNLNNFSNDKHIENNSRKKMGNSQINFYKRNSINFFPNIQNSSGNNNNNLKENLYSINSKWLLNSHNNNAQQEIYNYFINNIKMNNNNPRHSFLKENYMRIFEFDYKRKEEKLKKGQNQLILERLQKKYENQIREQNMHRTGTGFYPKNKKNTKRQQSAQDNNDIIISDDNNQFKKIKSEMNNKNNMNSMNSIDKERIQIDANQNLNLNNSNNNKLYNKTYNNGFNLKKNKKERKKKEKLIFSKIFKYFKKKPKNNYLWVRYFNRKIKMRLKEEEENDYIFNKNNGIHKKQKSLDRNNIYPKLIKKILRKNIIFKSNKKILIIKHELKCNTDNSEIDEIKEYKKLQKKMKAKKPDNNTYYNNFNKNNNQKKIELESPSESDDSFPDKKEPQFRGIFDKDDKNINETKEEKEQRKRFNYKTTSNFFSKNNNNFKGNKPEKESQNDQNNEEKTNKYNIENIINNVIENNKKAAAARSSSSFYNIGSNFMNNRMRSTKTNFYSSKDNKGGGFTGTKDSNFAKAQANEGRYYKPNSLKITLINPLGWRKHEEIWSNLVSLKLGLSDLEKYLHPPNDTDVLVSSYLKMNPRILNFCSIQKINTSKTNNENNNFISFMIDDNIQNPKQEIKKWKEAFKRVIFRWHPDKLFAALEEINFKNEQQKIELKKRSTQIINNMNILYRNIIEILNKIAEAKHDKENNN